MKFNPFEYDKMSEKINSENNIKIGIDLINWLIKTPTTKRFVIENYYDEDCNIINSNALDKGIYYIVFVKDDVKYIFEVELLGYVNNKLLCLNPTFWYLGYDYDGLLALKKDITLDFIDTFNTKENTIMYTPTGIEIRKKLSVDYEINQFDVYKLAEEITNVIAKKRKRGYIFAGVPGTGKSSIILKLESLLPNYPILYVCKSAITFNGELAEVFALIQTLSPCIVIFEDLDCFGFANKSSRFFNEFLSNLDGIYEKYSSIII